MPVYEYECRHPKCGARWETEQKISAPAIRVCRKCGRRTARRLIAGKTGFVLAGGGWAKTGYQK